MLATLITAIGAGAVTTPCPAWCVAPFVRSWACETATCAPCRDACDKVPFPQRQLPKVGENSRRTKRRVGAVYAGMSDSWSCHAAWPPHRLFVIFAMPRTGSTTLCGVLNTLEDTHCAYEALNPGELASQDQRAMLASDSVQVLREEFEGAYSGFGRAPCAWGFKIFPQHLRNSTFMAWLWSHIDSAIMLERINGSPADMATRTRPSCPH